MDGAAPWAHGKGIPRFVTTLGNAANLRLTV